MVTLHLAFCYARTQAERYLSPLDTDLEVARGPNTIERYPLFLRKEHSDLHVYMTLGRTDYACTTSYQCWIQIKQFGYRLGCFPGRPVLYLQVW